jgi:hypothetical protein
MKFEGTLSIDKEGQPRIQEKAMWQQWCSDHKGKKCQVIVKPLSRKSDPMRRYYFGVVVEMYRTEFRKLGHNLTKDDTHEFIKTLCPSMKREMVLPTGEIVTRWQSIADPSFSNTDFMDYLAELQQYAAENLDLIIPDPNEFGIFEQSK